MTGNDERRERVKASKEIDALIRESSVGGDAWVECEVHGTNARDPYTGECVDCAHPQPRTMCLAHMEPEPCQTCAAYIAAGL